MAKSFSFGSYEVKKFAKGLGIAFLGAFATYLAEYIPGVDFGAWTPLVVMLNSALVNAIQLFVADHQYE